MKNPKTKGASRAKGGSRAKPASRAKSAPRAAVKAMKPAAKATGAAKGDPRSVPAPTAPASVARKAAAAIASAEAVATAGPKKAAEAAKPASAAASKPVSMSLATPAPTPTKSASATAPVAPEPTTKAKPEGVLPSPEKGVAPLATALEAGVDQARAAFARTRATGDTLRDAMAESTTTTTRGLLEINGKVLDLMRAQGDAISELWRSTLSAGSLSEAVRAHTSGLRHAYEVSTAQWKAIAETAGRVMGDAAKPVQSALSQGR